MTNTPSKFVEIDIAVIHTTDMPNVVRAAKSGDPESRYITAGVGDYLQRSEKTTKAECGLCDHKFDEGDVAHAFLVLMVVDEGKRHLVVAGICLRCLYQDPDTLRASVEKSVRDLYPSFTTTPPRPAH